MAAGKSSKNTAGQSPGRQIISMPTVKITDNNHVAEIALHNAEVKQECITTGPEAPARRIVLRDAETEVRLHLSWASTARERKRLVERLSRRDHAEVSLGGPILAIDAIRRPAAWPADQEPTPVAVLAVAPDGRWLDQPIPTLRGELEPRLPDDVLRIQVTLAGYPSLDLPYEQIQSVEQPRDNVVLVKVKADAPNQALGAMLVGVSGERVATGLAEGLRSQRVRRIRASRETPAIFLLPHISTASQDPRLGGPEAWIETARANLRRSLMFAGDYLTRDQIEAELKQGWPDWIEAELVKLANPIE